MGNGEAEKPAAATAAAETPILGDEGRRRYSLLPKNRFEGFSDGVLAIVITLLVLELEVPEGHNGVAEALAEQWRSYLGYVVSFSFVGGWWIAHSNLTRFIKAGNGVIFRLNLLALLFVSFLPYTANLMSAHGNDEAARLVTVIFGIDLLLASFLLSLFAGYLAREKDLVADEIAEADLTAVVKGRWWAIGVLVAALIVAVVEPTAAILLYLVATVAFIVEPLIPRGHRSPTEEPMR